MPPVREAEAEGGMGAVNTQTSLSRQLRLPVCPPPRPTSGVGAPVVQVRRGSSGWGRLSWAPRESVADMGFKHIQTVWLLESCPGC